MRSHITWTGSACKRLREQSLKEKLGKWIPQDDHFPCIFLGCFFHLWYAKWHARRLQELADLASVGISGRNDVTVELRSHEPRNISGSWWEFKPIQIDINRHFTNYISVETADLFPMRLRGRQTSLAVRWCVPVLNKRDRDETGNSCTSGCMIHNVFCQQFNLTTSEVFEVELRNVPLFVAVMGHAWSLKSDLWPVRLKLGPG